MSPDRQPNAVREVLGCAKAEALMLRNALPGGWARWGKTVQLASLTSSYSSLQGTDRYLGESNTGTSRRSHIRRLSSHEAVTVSSCLNTPVISHRSKEHTWGKSRCLSVSITAGRCQPCMAWFLLEREDREKRPAAYLLGLAPHWLNAPCVLLFSHGMRNEIAINKPNYVDDLHKLLHHAC